MQSFVYAEYLALALGKVWGDKAKLPSYEEQWRLHRERVHTQGGYGRHFQFLGATRTAGGEFHSNAHLYLDSTESLC